MNFPFRVKVHGSFYTFELYDDDGKCIYSCSDAAMAAETQYGSEWDCVYNGDFAMTRDEFLGKEAIA